ncbi:MAG: TIGR03118 family protein, partial [Ferruginibacter sp.]
KICFIMKNFNARQFPIFRVCLFLFLSFLFITGCKKTPEPQQSDTPDVTVVAQNRPAGTAKQIAFGQVNLVANNASYGAGRIDDQLVNAWGLSWSPNGIAWIGSEDAHVSNVFNSDGGLVRPAVNIPSPTGPTGGSPTGVVFSGSATDFKLPAPNNQAARFIFVGVDGILSAWNGAAGASAMLIKNNSGTAVYTGLAIANRDGKNYLYAANFKSRKIDVFDKDFNPVWMPFKDWSLPDGYAPFNIQLLNNQLYVMYAKVGPNGDEEVGQGNGYVSIFAKNGTFIKRFASRGQLNAPWGIAWAPKTFFEKSGQNSILIGNFGNGHINAYSTNGTFIRELSTQNWPIAIDGLWAISFPPRTATAIDSNRLYFCAGPKDETDGLFGYILR